MLVELKVRVSRMRAHFCSGDMGLLRADVVTLPSQRDMLGSQKVDPFGGLWNKIYVTDFQT